MLILIAVLRLTLLALLLQNYKSYSKLNLLPLLLG
jgi:hypothetical protein